MYSSVKFRYSEEATKNGRIYLGKIFKKTPVQIVV
jgi:hypothetical protein